MDPRRCEIHGTALTATGACLLCLRRSGRGSGASENPSRALGWLVAGVVGVALGAAVVYRVHLALTDRALARPEVVSSEEPPQTPRATPTTAAITTATATPAISGPEWGRDPGDAEREHALRVAEAERSVEIDFYGAGWCPSCRKARAWLDAQGIAYQYRDTTDEVNRHTMRALNPNGTIPTISIDGQVVVGFRPNAMRAMIRGAAEARVAKTAARAR